MKKKFFLDTNDYISEQLSKKLRSIQIRNYKLYGTIRNPYAKMVSWWQWANTNEHEKYYSRFADFLKQIYQVVNQLVALLSHRSSLGKLKKDWKSKFRAYNGPERVCEQKNDPYRCRNELKCHENIFFRLGQILSKKWRGHNFGFQNL